MLEVLSKSGRHTSEGRSVFDEVLRVRILGDPVLRQTANPIVSFDARLQSFVTTMRSLLLNADVGIGLAAPQIGVSQRIVVYDERHVPAPRIPAQHRGVFINPEVLESDGTSGDGEACLSFPGEYFKVPRAERVLARSRTIDGDVYEFEADDLLARLVQHEVDHLNGRLIVDHLPINDRSAAIARYNERIRTYNAASTSLSMADVDRLFVEHTGVGKQRRRRPRRP